MASKLIEYGGLANVLLRAKCDFTVNDYEFKKDEIVLYLENVNFNFGYGNVNSNAVIRKENVLSYGERKINSVIIRTEAFRTKYLGLFSEKKYETYLKTKVEEIEVDEDGVFYTIDPIAKIDEEYFIDTFNEGRVAVEVIDEEVHSYRIIPEDAGNEGEEEEEPSLTGTMNVAYYTSIDIEIYDINKNMSLPYFSMEINTVGNVDKVDGNLFMKIGTVSLLTEPEFSVDNSINKQDLVFSIIKDEVLFGNY